MRIRDLIGRGDTYPEARRAVVGLTRIGQASTAVVSGVLATTPDLTVLNCARVLPLDWAVVIADAALHQGLVDPGALATAAHRTRRVRGGGTGPGAA